MVTLNQALRRNVQLTNQLLREGNKLFDLKQRYGQLEDELADLKAQLQEEKDYALDQLNDRAEAVAELRARAAPEGWQIQSLITGNNVIGLRQVSCFKGESPSWYWDVFLAHRIHKSGYGATMEEATKAAEAVKIPKVKKAKRK